MSKLGSARRLIAAGGAAVILTLGACIAFQWKPLGPHRSAPVPGAEMVGSEECLVCHDEVQGRPEIARYHEGCETCHGGGSLHSESEARLEIRFPANGDCLACHVVGRRSHLQWGTGEHARAGVYCTDCHNPHTASRRHLRTHGPSPYPDIDAVSGLCLSCHPEVAARLAFPSHHPLPQGGMSCLGCHDPHEDRRVAFGDENQDCADCHQDYMGPWTFEHPPTVEGCTICHNPHGAVADNLLDTDQPALCLSCHSLNDLWHHGPAGTGDPFSRTITQDFPNDPMEIIKRQNAMTFLRRCTDCHGAIHGSYTDEHLRH